MGTSITNGRGGPGLETDLRLELAVAAHEEGAPGEKSDAVAGGGGKEPGGPWSAFEKTAGWVAAGLGAVATTFTVVGATTDQVHVMTTAFPDAVKAMFFVALVAIVVVGAAWAVPNGTVFGAADLTPEVLAKHKTTKWVKVRRWIGHHWWVVRLAASAVVVGALSLAWQLLRVKGSNFNVGLPVWFVVPLGVLVVLLFLPKKQTVTGALLVAGLAMFAMAIGGAIHLGVNATKFGFSMSAVPTVTVDGSTAIMSVAVKATQLPSGGGLRVYLVDNANPTSVVGSSYVAASVSRSADTAVSFRVPSSLAAVDVRLVRCFYQPVDQLKCAAPAAAASFATATISTGAPAPSLAASIAATDNADIYAITVTGSGLRDIVTITVTGSETVRATAQADENGSLSWTTSVHVTERNSATVNVASGTTTANASLRR
jgi:hypothetical protein